MGAVEGTEAVLKKKPRISGGKENEMIIHESHTVYQPSDFTVEEIRRGNVLAVAVIVNDEKICMICNRSGECLESPCRRVKCPKHTTGGGPCYCGKEGV